MVKNGKREGEIVELEGDREAEVWCTADFD